MRKLITTLVFRNSTGPIAQGNEPYFNFLKKGTQKLQLINPKARSKLGHKIHVPHKPLGREQVKKFFQQNNLRQKNMIIDVDSSHLLGVRRMLILQHLKKNVYKDIQQPIETLSQTNPEYEMKLEELHFNQDIFFMTDPKFVYLWDTDKSEDQIDTIVQDYYDNHIDRGVQRLKYDYKLPEQFLHIIEQAHNFDNKIHFAGINEYDFRNIIWLYHTIDELKTMFVNAMHYWKNTEAFLQSENKINMVDFNNKCREYIHQETYNIFQPYRYNRLKLIRAKIGHSFTFAHEYAFQKVGIESMNIQTGKAHGKATQSDKIEKHAILEIMLGNLWNQPYSKCKFPNLGQEYNKLSRSDQQIIDSIYNKHCNIYLKAIEKFRDKYYNETSQKLKASLSLNNSSLQ